MGDTPSSTPDLVPVPQPANLSRLAMAPPDVFTGDRKRFHTFGRQLALNFTARPDLYGPENPHHDANRILYTLSYMRGGLAEQWANQYIDQHLVPGNPSLGTWTSFCAAMGKAFEDSNTEVTTQHRLETMRQDQRPAEEFFMEFEQVFQQAGYSTPVHDTFLISTLERNLHPALVDKIYGLEQLLTRYEEWCDKATNFDQLHRRREERKKALRTFWSNPPRGQGPTTTRVPAAEPTPCTATVPNSGGGRTYGGAGAPMDLDRARAMSRACYNCGKEGHIARNCRQPRQPRTYARTMDSEAETMRKERDELKAELEALRALKESDGAKCPQSF